MICKICNKTFKNNFGGQLTNHLLHEHHITNEEYVIITEHYGIPPKCKCGYCNKNPRFNRGKFSNYSIGHNNYKHKEFVYIKLNGTPRCILCESHVKFNRGVPNKLCEKCVTSEKTQYAKNVASELKFYAFQNKDIQDKISKNVYKKYGVKTVSQVQEYRNKISNSHKGMKIGIKLSEEHVEKIRNNSKIMWKSKEHRLKTIPKIILGTNTEKEIKRRRDYIVNRIENEVGYLEFLIDTLASTNNKTSKLHLKINGILDLKNKGFISEYKLYPYIYDEVNLEKKIIIEINGDYVHANPKIYDKDFIIKLPNTKYSSSEKWEYDNIKRIHAEKTGFMYFVVWESDLKDDINLTKINEMLQELL